MSYLALRYVHVGAVIASFCLFFLRGLCTMTAPGKLAARQVRVVPHVVDTVLLASAIALATMTAQYPFMQPWLTATVLALALHVLFGAVAIRRGRTRRARSLSMGNLIRAGLICVKVFRYGAGSLRALPVIGEGHHVDIQPSHKPVPDCRRALPEPGRRSGRRRRSGAGHVPGY